MASQVHIERIEGLDNTSSDTDLKMSIATELKNFSTTKSPGKLSKAGAYSIDESTLFGSNLGSIGTIQNATELSLTQPSSQDIYIIHSNDGSNDRLYYGKYWDGSSFQNGTEEITEHVATQITLIAADVTAGTNADKIVIDSTNSDYGDLSTTDDYYNQWIITVTIASASKTTAAVVTDYDYDGVADTKTLTVTTGALNGIAASDTFYLSKYPVIAYNSSGSDLGGIAVVDDDIRFLKRENAVIGMTGNTSKFPTQYQLWFGYINARRFGDSSSSSTFSDFWFDVQQMLAPAMSEAVGHANRSILELTKQSSVGATIDQEMWEFKTAYEYDGFQLGPLSRERVFVDLSGGPGDESIRIYLNIPYNACYDSSVTDYRRAYDSRYESEEMPSSYSGHLLSRRVTGLYIFAKNSTVTGGLYKQLKYYVISGDADEVDLGSNDVLTLDATGMLKISGTGYLEYISDPTVGDVYETVAGQSGLRPNFKYATPFEDHIIVGAIRNENGNKRDNFMAASTIQGNSASAFDSFGGSNQTNLGFYGSQKITGMVIIGDTGQTTSPKRRMAVFCDDDLYVLQMTSGSSYAYQLDRIGHKEGCVAPDSIVNAEGLTFYVSRNGFRALSPQGTQQIGVGLRSDFDALTSVTDAIGGYLKRERVVIWAFPTDNKVYAVDLLNGLNMYEMSYNDTMTTFFSTRLGELYASDGTDIFKLENGTTQNGSAITPSLKSKKITSLDFKFQQDDEIMLIEGYIRYKSDTAITLKAYLDGSGTALSFNNLSLPAKTIEDDVRFKFPLGSNCKDVQIETTLTTTQASTNTSFDINKISLIAEPKKRLR